MPFAEILAGQDGISTDENPRRIPVTALVSGSGVVAEDGVWRKEPGASLYDAAGIAGTPSAQATLNPTRVWVAQIQPYVGGTPAFVKLLGTNTSDNALVTTLAVTVPVGGAALGNLVAVTVAEAITTAIPSPTLSDSRANVYVNQIQQQTPAGYRLTTFTTVLATALLNSDVITVTISGGIGTVVSMVACEYTLQGAIDTNRSTGGSSTTALIHGSTLAAVPGLLIGSFLVSGLMTDTFTPDLGATLGGRGGSTTANIGQVVASQTYRVDSGSPTIIAAHDWWPDATTQRLITATLDGKLYKDDNAGNLDAVTLKSGLSLTARPGRFVPGGKEAAGNNRKLFYLNGVDIPQVLSANGATTSNVSAPPADWSGTNQPVNAIIHRDRLGVVGNANDGHRLYLSLASNHEDFTTTPLNFSVYPSVGDRLYGLADYLGLLWMWKFPYGIFWLDDSDTNSANWAVQQRTHAVGCAASPYAVLPIDNDVMFLAADGSFHLLSAVQEGITRDSDVTAALRLTKWMRDNVNLSRLNQVVSVWYPQKKRAIWGLPATGSTVNNIRLVFDFLDVEAGGRTKFTTSTRDNMDALALRRGTDGIQRPILGQGGTIYLMEQDARNKGGNAYTGSYQTAHTDMSHIDPRYAVLRKNWKWLVLEQNPTASNYTLTVLVYLDRALSQTLTFRTDRRLQRQPLTGVGHEISFAPSNANADEDFAIVRHLVEFSDSDAGPM